MRFFIWVEGVGYGVFVRLLGPSAALSALLGTGVRPYMLLSFRYKNVCPMVF